MNTSSSSLLAIVREVYGRVVWTHKVHEKQREVISARVTKLKWANVVFVGATTLAAIWGAADQTSRCAFWLATVLGVIATSLQVYGLSFNPEREELAHRTTAKALLQLRDRLLVLIENIMVQVESESALRSRFGSLMDEWFRQFEAAPDTSPEAYEKAKQALQVVGEFTFSADEIDLLLPVTLRIGKKPSA